MVSSGVWCPDGYWRVRHRLSEGNAALKLTFTAQFGGGEPWRSFEVQVPH